MFIRQGTLVGQRGKVAALLPASLSRLHDYTAGSLGLNLAHFGVACYWRAVEGGQQVTAFGYFSIVVHYNGEQQYTLPDGRDNFWLPGEMLAYQEFLLLGAIGVSGDRYLPSFELTHKLGKRSPYGEPHYAARFFPELETFYDVGLHRVLHANPEALPEGVDGWYKWSDKRVGGL